jgi:superfamily I DNA/RNA helicase
MTKNSGERLRQIANVITAEFSEDLVLAATSPDWPNILWVSKRYGAICFEVSESRLEDEKLRVRLNQKITLLEQQVAELNNLQVKRVLVTFESPDKSLRLPATTLISDFHNYPKIFSKLSEVGMDPALYGSIVRRLEPTMTFMFEPRKWSFDEKSETRVERRIVLDAEQSEVAQFDASENCQIIGPPGSGKSLVLAARAKWIATSYPTWKVALIVFNKNLETYFRNLLKDTLNIEVAGFDSLARSLGHRVDGNDDARAVIDLRNLKKMGIEPLFDAILVDEYQDFSDARISYLVALLKDCAGGITIAGDTRQAIYQEFGPSSTIRSLNLRKVELSRSYRSTEEILKFTAAFDPDFGPVEIEGSQSGLPVDIVHTADWDSQARAAVWEVQAFLVDSNEINNSIAVLVARKSLLTRIVECLEIDGIDFTNLAERDEDGNAHQTGKVTVGTIHATKGLEFDCVILLGLDAIKPLSAEEDPQKSRIAYVGPTRARNRLIVMYSKPTEALSRLAKLREGSIKHWEFPDDYEVRN